MKSNYAMQRSLDLFMRFVLLALLFIASVVAANGAEPPTFHERVLALYSYSPRTLSKKQIEAKSNDLDAFWDAVKSSGTIGADELRKELARTDSPPFFNYDGAQLLLSISRTTEDRTLALAAIGRTDILDIQREDYFLTVHWFAVDEYDTSEAAFKILDDPNFQVFIPQHAMTLDQESCLSYLLLPTKEEFYLKKAETRLFTETDITAQESLLSLIAHTATRSGDETISRFAASLDQPEESRKFAKLIIDSINSMESAATPDFSTSSYDALKAEQRKLFARVSDEALYDWQSLRLKIRRKGPE
jgi:hypothetical protein